MLPLVEIPPSIKLALAPYRKVFCREEGFSHVSRYISGLLLSENKTLQGIHSQWIGEEIGSRRGMHEAVFENGWSREKLMAEHRSQVGKHHQGKGKEVISLDWTLAHHEQAQKMYGAKKGYDYVNNCMSCYQTVMTAVVANRETIDGLSVEVQQPNYFEEELAYLNMTVKDTYEQMEEVKGRIEELLHYQKNRLAYRTRTQIVVEMVKQIEAENNFPNSAYAFDNGLLSRPLTELIEKSGKHWVSEIEKSRLIWWEEKWQRVEHVAQQLREQHRKGFRPYEVICRNDETRKIWAFTKTVRLKKYGQKRLVIVHEQEDLGDSPRFLLTDAKHWESRRIYQTWSYRWSIEVFHEFSKQITGFESAQLRNEEAVKRHFCLSSIAQSILQRVIGSAGKSERFKFANTQQTIGQKLYSLNREALSSLFHWAERLFAQGQSAAQLLSVAMPV